MTPHPLIEQHNRSEHQLRALLAELPKPVINLMHSALRGDPASRATFLRVLASLG